MNKTEISEQSSVLFVKNMKNDETICYSNKQID